jgi:hypothetical protein
MQSRTLLHSVWFIALAGLTAWSLIAWATGALISGSGDWLSTLATQWIESPRKEALIDAALAWIESFGVAAVWALWALGSLGLVLTAVYATFLLLKRRAIEAL